MAGVVVSPYECPVCADFFKSPKLLPCDHLVCRTCVISWLQTTGGRGKCPICRAPILSAIPQDQAQLEAQVDRLQSDLATHALADSHKILSDKDECTMCQNNVAGHNFCLQCSVKLCTPCTLYHQKLPASAHHTVEQLSKLTVKKLAARHQVKCKTHTHQVVELYCPSHGELMCCRCGSTTHRVCAVVKEIEDAAKEERRKFKDQLGRLKVKERKLTKQVSDAKQQFMSMRKAAKDVFDDLSESVEKQRRDVNNLIQAEEDTVMALLAEVEKARVSIDFPLRNIENLVLESPDDGLLEMLQQLASRLNNLESQTEIKNDARDVGCLVLDDQIIRRLKSDLAKLGRMQQPHSQLTSAPVAGAIPTTSATASGQIQQPQSQPTSTPAAGATTTTSFTALGLARRPQSQPTSALSVGAIPRTSATASGQIQQPQQQTVPASSAEPIPRRGRTSFFGLFRPRRRPQTQPTSTPTAGATPRNSATASGQAQQPQQQTVPASAAETTPRGAWAGLFGLLHGQGPTTAAKPEGAALAGVLKVGDRVKVAPFAPRRGVPQGATGTVIAIPSQKVTAQIGDFQGWVDVRWDSGGVRCHRMGRNDQYHLILA